MTTLTPTSAKRVGTDGLEARVENLRLQVRHLENSIHHQLVKHSITALRISLGLVFLGFGILKYFPGVSPAQNVTEATTHILFLGLIPGSVAIKMIATLECFIGICLLTNRWMRLAVWLLAIEFIGILSPVFLLSGRLFSGPHHAPTLLGQYCLKDIILVAAGLVVAAASFRGGRMVRADLPPSVRADRGHAVLDPEQRLAIVTEGLADPAGTRQLCELNHISETDLHAWTRAVLSAAAMGPTVPVSTMTSVATVAVTGPAGDEPVAARPMGPVATLLAIAVLRR